MPVLVLQQPDGTCREQPLKADADLLLGSDPVAGLVLPLSPPRQALVTRSAVYRVPLLLDLTGGAAPPAVNGRRIAGLEALRHRDEIHLGEHRLVYWELIAREVTDGAEF